MALGNLLFCDWFTFTATTYPFHSHSLSMVRVLSVQLLKFNNDHNSRLSTWRTLLSLLPDQMAFQVNLFFCSMFDLLVLFKPATKTYARKLVYETRNTSFYSLTTMWHTRDLNTRH